MTTSNSRSQSLSWLDEYIIKVCVENVGVAFPLTTLEELQTPRQSKQGEGAVRAFLFSIKSVAFDTHRGESGQASMKNFSFQFVSRYVTSRVYSMLVLSLDKLGSDSLRLLILLVIVMSLATGYSIRK